MNQIAPPTASQSELTQLLRRRSTGSAAVRIARAISARGATTAEELARQTGLARSTVSTALAELRGSGIVVETVTGRGAKGAGRPVKVLSLNPEAGTTLGIHLSLESVKLAVVDVAHNVLVRREVALGLDYSPEVAAQRCYHEVQQMYAERGLSMAGLLGVGVSVSGPVTPDGTILHSSIVPKWAGQNARTIFEPIFRRPVTAENEANCAAIAEMTWGVAQEQSDFILVKIDLGVGGAIVQDRKVVSGVAGGGGEFGHIPMVPDGALCRCGNRGCLETIASFFKPLEILSKQHGRPVTMNEAFDMARAGDETVRRLIRETGANAGWGLAFASTILNPPMIIIGGQMAMLGEMLMTPLLETYERHTMIKPNTLPAMFKTTVIKGHFTADDSLRGAAGIVLHSIGDILLQPVA